MTTVRLSKIAGLWFALTLAGTGAACADEPWAFVQITCVPQLSYFSIQRFTIMNLPWGGPYRTQGMEAGPDAIAKLAREHQIFYSADLQTRPYTCDIPPITRMPGGVDGADERPGFSVRVIGHRDLDSDESSERRITDDVEVFLNGKSIGLMGLNDYGITLGPDTIQVAPNGLGIGVTICEVRAWPPDIDRHLTCTTK